MNYQRAPLQNGLAEDPAHGTTPGKTLLFHASSPTEVAHVNSASTGTLIGDGLFEC